MKSLRRLWLLISTLALGCSAAPAPALPGRLANAGPIENPTYKPTERPWSGSFRVCDAAVR